MEHSKGLTPDEESRLPGTLIEKSGSPRPKHSQVRTPDEESLIPGTIIEIKFKFPRSIRCETEPDEALIGKHKYSKVYEFANPCSRCANTGRTCVTSGTKSVKCEWCRVSKIPCDVNGVETVQFHWLRNGALFPDSRFDTKTKASSTDLPDEISLLDPEDEARVDDWSSRTKDVNPLDPSPLQNFGVEIPLARKSGSRIIQDDIRADRYLQRVMGWRRSSEAPPFRPLGFNTMPVEERPSRLNKRTTPDPARSEEEEDRPKRKIRVKIRKPPGLEVDHSSSPTAHSMPRTSHPQPSQLSSLAPARSLPPPSIGRAISPVAAPPLSNLAAPRSSHATPKPPNLPSNKPPHSRQSPAILESFPPPVLEDTSKVPLFRLSSPLESEERTNEQVQYPDDEDRATGKHGQVVDDHTRLNKAVGAAGTELEHQFSLAQHGGNQRSENTQKDRGDDIDSDDSSVDWGVVEPNNFDGNVVAEQMKKAAKDMERFMASKMLEIAALIPAGHNFNNFIAMRKAIQDKWKGYKEKVNEAVKPLQKL
ncbi:uncharacterized protein MELLADRAFT_87787 [Melampsora larici-populina 98AG31]|uniref:Uncharacterized protein n=1 Tax=Melampsora larici-populina (strain 98AG31 / pathotype 3-4-7) TaxID=747676 RepID=F4RPG8_MELLP|nr:uncharacterized protein MELLADRAFT_87787 [Melampsora larici-populina 98AG31]EGG05723.1 hypothetical protein MELLADRAFT_87787 [Melampsora larici-populina 98AG31]